MDHSVSPLQNHTQAMEQTAIQVAPHSMQGNIFTCTLCQRTCDNAEKYESQRTPGNFICIKCHLKEGSSMNKIRYKCAICDRLFIDLQKAQLHSKAHANTPEVSVSVTDSTEQTYMVQIVEGDGEKGGNKVIHYCDICGKGYTWINSLHRHKKLHCTENLKIKNTSFKNYKCEICGKGFTWRSNLNRHKQTHRDKIIYIFRTDGEDMTLEEDTAATDKPFHVTGIEGTDYLEMDSTYEDHLVEEQIENKDVDKTFTCDVCGKSFLWQNSMITHRNSHFVFNSQPNIGNTMTYSNNIPSLTTSPNKMEQMGDQSSLGNMIPASNTIVIQSSVNNLMTVNNPGIAQVVSNVHHPNSNTGNINTVDAVVQVVQTDYICDVCGGDFFTQKNLEAHKQVHLIPEVVIGYSETNHMEYPALPSDKKFACDVCGLNALGTPQPI
ncbi:Zinc finger protein 227 [Mizuhopecten yessoensis]|uniref:Zinc finger protein 227 n=1 Tax=Mizuhopecten yessoensis TaxID=6573 RepID=A0A210Q8W0_MIZYE|nr:Zinc finger protein 227 [Mizuhopecten yessoensis]